MKTKVFETLCILAVTLLSGWCAAYRYNHEMVRVYDWPPLAYGWFYAVFAVVGVLGVAIVWWKER